MKTRIRKGTGMTLALAISAMLVLPFGVPAAAYADEIPSSGDSGTILETEPESITETDSENPDGTEEVSLDETEVPLADSSAVEVKKVSKKSGKYSVSVKQNKVNYRKATITIGGVKKLKKSGITKVKIKAAIYNGKKVATSRSKTVKIKNLVKKNKFTMTFPAFGKYTVKASFYKGKKKVKTLKLRKVGIVAEEYNLAVLNGTFAPLIMTMQLWDITTQDGKPVPTIVGLNRADAWNWKKTPTGVYNNPVYPSKKLGNFTKKVKAMAKYAGDLYEMNKNSKFHFYLADNAVRCIMDIAYKNKIQDDSFDLTLISDGAGTYHWFNKLYNKSNPDEKLATMMNEWENLKQTCLKGKTPKYTSLKYKNGSGNGVLGMSRYTYAAVANQSNYRWQVARQSNFEAANEEFLENAKNRSEQVSTGSMLAALQEKGEKTEKAFKALYRFNNDMFEKAVKNKKKVMLFMGTRTDLEQNFEEFAGFVRKYYGKDYVYYYKGHPATPTRLHPDKEKQLDKLNIIDVESSVAAEIILYFNPDVKVSNVANSSTNEAYTEGMPKAFNGVRLADSVDPLKVTKPELFECFFTKITSDYEAEIIALCSNDSSLKYSYLVEFAGKEGEIAIYNSSKDTLTKYKKQEDGSYKKQ